jgi:orotate phosphoribosyltransferase
MPSYRDRFIDFALAHGVLKFGEFTLKSGRRSPYFFNSGLFNTGTALRTLGGYYRDALESAALHYDMLYGPAYKGIPLAAALAIAIAERDGRSVPFCFNRKEAKDHGEGGSTFGAALAGRVLIVDDVITAGTSVAESVQCIRAAGAVPAGVLIALDRQERGHGGRSAVQDVEQAHGIPVSSIVTLADLVTWLERAGGNDERLRRIRDYRSEHGV